LVVTRTMQKYLEETQGKNPSKDSRSSKYTQHLLYMKRLQKRLERELNMLLWLAVNHPDIFLYKEQNHYRKSSFDGKERIRKIMLTVKALIGTKDVELFLDLDKISRSERHD
jgi:hypothetical protein